MSSTPTGHKRIIVQNLSKSYRTVRRKNLVRSTAMQVNALNGVSFEVAPGEIFGLLGPNGAGKTTLIKCITTLLTPSGGKAWINGYRLTKEDARIRATIGCMLVGDRALYWKLTGRENLIFFGALYHLPTAKRRRRANELLERFGLEEFADRAVETYSSGQRMKLSFAKTLVNEAPVIVLDEPTNTLDPRASRELREAVCNLRDEGRAVLYTTHLMPEAESLCDRLAILDQGQILAVGTVDQLKDPLRRKEVIHVEGIISASAMKAVRSLSGVCEMASVTSNGSTHLTVTGPRLGRPLLPELITSLAARDAVLWKISSDEVTLEDVFIARTGRSLAEKDDFKRAGP